MAAEANVSKSSLTPRAVILAMVLIPLNAYWIVQSEYVIAYGSYSAPTCISLFFNVICIVFALVLLNALIRKTYPSLALKQGELLVIYYMLCIASFISGEEMMQTLISMSGHAFWNATPENEWQVFHGYLPSWLTVREDSVLWWLYESQETASLSEAIRYLQAWLPVVLAWSGFLTVLVFVMYCINVILRKQWMDHERLSYPVVRLPLELIKDAGSLNFLRKRTVWAGWMIAASINLVNGFSFLYPVIPSMPIKAHDIGYLFNTAPWNAIGWTPISFYPFVIGLGFLIPLHLSFSCWFFYLFYKMLLVLGKATGFVPSRVAFHPNEQMLGAYLGVLAIALWSCRRYLAGVLSHLFRSSETADKDEPMQYRNAILGVLIGFALLVVFSVQGGMSLWVAILFFVLYFAISTSITRLRAELGTPVHDLWSLGSTGPETLIMPLFGTRRLNPQTLGMITLYYGFNMDYRGHAMPHQLESLKVADALNLNWKRFGFATVLAAFFGGISAFGAIFYSCYKFECQGYNWTPDAFERLQRWLFYPSATDVPSLGFVGFGAAFTFLLMIIRAHLIWFPFHPLGYLLASGWTMNLIWFPLFIGWAVKRLTLKSGGLRGFRQFTPFFLGLILGDFIVGGFWTLAGIILGIPIYTFWI